MTMQTGGRLAGAVMLLGAVVVCFAVAAPAGEEDQERIPIEVSASDYTYSPVTQLAHGEGNLLVRYQDVSLRADAGDVNFKTWDVSATGHVVLTRGDFEWTGEAVSGNIKSKRFRFGTFDVKYGVWYGKGAEGIHDSRGVAQIKQARISTCDLPEPHYSLSAERILYYPDGRFRAYNTVYRVLGVPVFYWPVVFGDSTPKSGTVQIRPGYSSSWGAYLLLARTWQISDDIDTTMHLDLRSKNGVALGNETHINKPYYQTNFTVYGMRDQDTPKKVPLSISMDPTKTDDNYNRRFDAADTRYRAQINHRQELDRQVTLRVNVDALSDIDMLEDWFKDEYNANPQSTTKADVVYDAQRLHVSLGIRPRINDFYTVREELPELRLDMPRQTLSDALPLQYQGSTSAGFYRMDWRDFDVDRRDWTLAALPRLADQDDYDSFRVDSLHMLYLPFDVAGDIRVVPRAGLRLTYYTDSSEIGMSPSDLEAYYAVDDPFNPNSLIDFRSSNPLAAKQYDSDGGSLFRAATEFGVEASTKYYRVWPDAVSGVLGIDGLRHVIQPSINYTLAPDPTHSRDNIYFFDETDRLTEQHFVRFGVDQRVQTRRDKRVYTLARIQSYADLHFSDKNDNGQDYDALGDFGNRVEFFPTEAVKTWAMVVTDLDEMDVRRAELGVKVRRKDGIRFSLAYMYRDNYYPRSTASMGSTLLDLTGEHGYLVREYREAQTAVSELYIPINEKTAGRIRLEYDLEDMQVSQQVYEIIRDLHCWMGSLAVGEDNGDVMVMVVLYLKALPGVKLDVGM